MNIKKYFLFFALFIPCVLNAQMQQLNSSEIELGISKLSVKGSVLYIAAHPDDENTRLLAYLAKELKVRTGYLSLTRGDGGQNLIGNEQAELLGLIRTQELLAARKVDGAEQFFTRANDFGFSKTADETFKIWDKERILGDMVWVIRKFRPDVIITRFPEDARAGHGQHAASAILAREAFRAAGDRSRFPEQLNYVGIWVAKRILWNTYNFGNNNTTSPDQLKIDVGAYNPLLGKGYGEIAAISRTNHKSQGFGSALQRGEALEYFSHVIGDTAKNSLLDGVTTSIYQNDVGALITQIQKNFNSKSPWQSLPDLLKLKKLTKNRFFNHHQLVDELILACTGIWIDANAAEADYAAGDTIPVKIQAIVRAQTNFPLNVSVAIENQEPVTLQPNKMLVSNYKISSSTADITQHYWLKENHPIGQYVVNSLQEIGQPENPKQLSIKTKVEIDGEIIEIKTPITYKSVDPIKGELYQPLVVAPKVTASLNEKAYIFVRNAPKTIEVSLKSFSNNSKGYITPILPKGWTANPEKIDFNLAKKGDLQTLAFTVTPGKEVASGNLDLQINVDGNVYDKGLKVIKYDHIPTITLFTKATAKLENVDVKITGKKIAYIDGAGDLVADALKQIGYEVTHLTPNQILTNDISVYDAIVTGIRLYNVNDEIKNIQSKLMDYVYKGGVLLHQYNVNTGLKINELGPYPFKVGNRRVAEEDAKVKFLNPDDASLNYPNKITEKDFDGWVQERLLYAATDIDPKYTTILSMNDTGEEPIDGSLLVGKYGKGKFVYTSLVFFRELPAGVPGAYRLIANLLAKK